MHYTWKQFAIKYLPYYKLPLPKHTQKTLQLLFNGNVFNSEWPEILKQDFRKTNKKKILMIFFASETFHFQLYDHFFLFPIISTIFFPTVIKLTLLLTLKLWNLFSFSFLFLLQILNSCILALDIFLNKFTIFIDIFLQYLLHNLQNSQKYLCPETDFHDFFFLAYK